MYRKIVLIVLILIFQTTYAAELEWRSIHFPFTNYSRIGIDGGASIYTLPSNDTLKFKIEFVFQGGIFTMPESNATTISALTDMLMLGGFGNKSYEQVQKELTENGITLSIFLNDLGEVVVNCEALTEDFDRVLNLMSDLILKPKFNEASLKLWKEQSKNQFVDFGNANTLGKQMLFIGVESARLAFGPEHYLANALKRASPASTQSVTTQNLKNVYSKILNRNGLTVLLSGAYPAHAQANVTKLMAQIPAKQTPILSWVPGRLKPQSSQVQKIQKTDFSSIKVAVIEKKDMTQSQISLRFYYPNFGELNPIEKAQIAILVEVFSKSSGVVGTDRFSKAMRADSGLSYSPHAYFKNDIIQPNTNLSAIIMNFQSPNEKVFEAVQLAQKTWNDFVQKGISASELNDARSAVMNSMLATEMSVFDKAEAFFAKIIHGKVPSVNPLQESLEMLDAQRSINDMNSFLIKKFSKENVGTLVIMGNPSDDEIKKLKEISALDFIETKEVNSFL